MRQQNQEFQKNKQITINDYVGFIKHIIYVEADYNPFEILKFISEHRLTSNLGWEEFLSINWFYWNWWKDILGIEEESEEEIKEILIQDNPSIYYDFADITDGIFEENVIRFLEQLYVDEERLENALEDLWIGTLKFKIGDLTVDFEKKHIYDTKRKDCVLCPDEFTEENIKRILENYIEENY